MSGPNPALEQFIRSIPLFQLVGPEDMTEVLRLLRPVNLTAGDVLFREGEPGRAMWVLSQGAEVSVTATAGQGRPVAVMYGRPGDVIGEMALVDDGPRSGTAVVTADGHAHQLDAQEFHSMRAMLVPAAFKILRKIAKDLCVRLRATNERIVPSSNRRLETPARPPGPRPEIELVDRFPPFAHLPQLVKLALAAKLEVLVVDEVTPIFGEGEPNDGAYFIVEGEVSVGRNGKTLANLPAGTMFGLVACIDEGTRSASCVTTGPAILLRMSDRDFDHLFASGHRFALQMVDLVTRQLVSHLREANRLLPRPGRVAGTARVSAPVSEMIRTEPGEEDLDVISKELEIETVLPLELELDLGDFSAEGEMLR